MFYLCQVINTFYRCILSSHEEADMDEILVPQIVAFLLDNHTEVLSVPTELKTHVEERLKDMQKPQVSQVQNVQMHVGYTHHSIILIERITSCIYFCQIRK